MPPVDSPPIGDVKGLETNNVQEFETKIYKEYAAAQDHEGIHKYTNVTIEEFLCVYLCVQYLVYMLTRHVCVYLSSCMCPEKAAKTRIALIKAHGLQMVKSLQSSAQQTSSCMQKWLKEHNLAEIKR